MSALTDVSSLVPVPGVSIIGRVVDFLTSFVKGKTPHATLAQVNAAEHDYRNQITASFSGFTSQEQIYIAQKAQPLLLAAMQIRWGMGGQGQPGLAQYVQSFGTSLENLGGAMFSWIAVNVDSSSASEMNTVMQWAWVYVFITAIQQAGLDPTRVKGSVTTTPGGGGSPTTTATAGFGGSILLILIVVGVLVGVARSGRRGS